MVRSHFRGYPIVFIDYQWVYEDTRETIEIIRPCKKCGAVFGINEVDPCLGNLPGVEDACCGHGVKSASYVSFTSGVVLRGFTKQEIINDKTS